MSHNLVDNSRKVKSRRRLLIIAIICNLLPLLWFKYANFFVENIEFVLDTQLNFTPPALPLGISFYTFIQIAYLVSLWRGIKPCENFVNYALFSSSFTYILSGPIVRYEHIGPQIEGLRFPTVEMLTLGLSLLSMGLAKKVIIADSLAPYANAVFNAAEKAWPITGAEAWLGSFCYSFQLYFDFSGYTDMAIGIGLMLGLRLPENFISPYRSTGIVEFWRRWHITLGLWLRDFLYIPMGGNRAGKLKQYRNLFLTMLIGGAWHGAGYTFIIWGALHGFMLCINHFFRAQIKDTKLAVILAKWPCKIFFIIFTFFVLNLCWVIFRTPTLNGAIQMYSTMFSGTLQSLPTDLVSGYLVNNYFQDIWAFVFLLLATFIVFCMPCSHEIFNQREDAPKCWLHFSFTRTWACVLALLAFISIVMLVRKSAFLYFQF